MMTIYNSEMPTEALKKYFAGMVGQFYKILPLKESGEPSLLKYMESLQRELIGCYELFPVLTEDAPYMSLITVLQYLIDNDCSTDVVRSEVFKAITICKKLKNKYTPEEA